MKLNWSHAAYVHLQNVPSYCLSAFALVIALILVSSCKPENWIKEYPFIKAVYYGITDVMFGPPKGVINFEPDKSVETHTIYVGQGKTKHSHRLFPMFDLLGVSFVVCIAFIFWDIFLLEETYLCNDITIDCFAFASNTESNLSFDYELVMNCSEYHDRH